MADAFVPAVADDGDVAIPSVVDPRFGLISHACMATGSLTLS